jgi:hypothetical protein
MPPTAPPAPDTVEPTPGATVEHERDHGRDDQHAGRSQACDVCASRPHFKFIGGSGRSL